MFCTDSKDVDVQSAMEKVTYLFEDKRFIKTVEEMKFFDYSNATPSEVIALILNHLKSNCIQIDTYHPWNPWTSAYARFQSKRPNTVQLSDRNLDRYDDFLENVASVGGSIVHEVVHLVDHHEPAFRFGHNGNGSAGRENTASYAIARAAKAHILKHY